MNDIHLCTFLHVALSPFYLGRLTTHTNLLLRPSEATVTGGGEVAHYSKEFLPLHYINTSTLICVMRITASVCCQDKFTLLHCFAGIVFQYEYILHLFCKSILPFSDRRGTLFPDN